jgi:UDP-N-acetylmuramoyl-tripeptide--D-alanyl-D-alanine ligase
LSVHFTIEKIATIVNGTIVHGRELAVVHDIVTDTRASLGEGAMFVALRGENFDGHHFLADAAARGAMAALVDRDHADAVGFAAVVSVDDTLVALQALATAHRAKFTGPVVGITGSNGKTIVKGMLAAIVGRHKTTYRSPGSFNSQVGVPLSVFGIRREHEVVILEAGISEPGEMDLLQPVILPDVGIITNIGEAHFAGFGDVEVTATQKLRLFADLHGPLIWNADDSVLRGRLANLKGLQLFGFGEAYDASYRIVKVAPSGDGFEITMRFPDGKTHRLEVHVLGRHNVWNAAAAAACADLLGVPLDAIREGLASSTVAPMRMEMHTTQSGVTLLNDAYSSDPVSAAAALNALVQYSAGNRTIAILGDMLDLGAASEAAHSELGALVARLRITHLVCVGPLARYAGRAAVENGLAFSRVWEVSDEEPLDELLDDIVEAGDYVLFKGSRAIGLERAAQSLLESVAPTRLYVDLGGIRENVQAIRRALGTKTAVMAVIKSFAYGNDANRVALTLENAGVDAFCVAFPDEGIPLRRRGIELPILVTNVRPS